MSSRLSVLSPYLIEINLASNHISGFNINLAGLNYLKVLNLSDNKIEGFLGSLPKLDSLLELNLSKNNITGINLSRLTNILKLNISFNLF